MAFDPEHRLVVSVVPGERTGESVRELVTDVKERLAPPELITTDEYTAYEGRSWRRSVPRWCRRGPASRAAAEAVQGSGGAALCHGAKTRKKGRVVDVVTQVIFGTAAAVEAALVKSG